MYQIPKIYLLDIPSNTWCKKFTIYSFYYAIMKLVNTLINIMVYVLVRNAAQVCSVNKHQKAIINSNSIHKLRINITKLQLVYQQYNLFRLINKMIESASILFQGQILLQIYSWQSTKALHAQQKISSVHILFYRAYKLLLIKIIVAVSDQTSGINISSAPRRKS